MKSKEEIIEILINSLDSVYCDTCSSNLSGEHCEECIRKQMNWGISENYAKMIADEILV